MHTEIIVPPREPIRTYGGVHPLTNEHRQVDIPVGTTIAEALEISLASTGLDWPHDRFVATVNDVRVPREHWQRVRPKPGTIVVFRPVASGDKALRSLLFLGVAIAALFIAPIIGGAFAAGSFFASSAGVALIGGAITIGGTLLLNALMPLRPVQQDTGQPKTLPMISGAQNEVRPWGAIPVVLGRHRISPMFAAMPYSFFSGQKQFMNMLYCCGYGPLNITKARIGDTLVTQFEEVTLEVDQGFGTENKISLFPLIANEQPLGMPLQSVDGFILRTTPDKTSTISIDVLAPNGIWLYNASGVYVDRPVTVEIQFKLHSDAVWIELNPLVFTLTRDAVRKGRQWVVNAGSYDVRLRKLTSDYAGIRQVADQIQWMTLRSFETGVPINFPKALGLVGMRARGSDQFNGIISTFNVIAESFVSSWNGTAWIPNTLSSNPADLFHHVLTGPANARPRKWGPLGVGDQNGQIDYTSIQQWHDDCLIRGYTYNAVISDQRTVRDVLSDIAAAGRATVALRNGKWGVSFSRDTDSVSWHFTPRNSSGLKTSRTYRELPHALRVRWINHVKDDFQQSEGIVYNDTASGTPPMYTEATAHLFETVEFPGLTDWGNVYKAARFQLAQALLRPETHTLNADIESLRLERGDKVLMSSDALLIGTGYGRVTSVDAAGDTCLVDSRVIMEAGKSYQIQFTKNNPTTGLVTILQRTVLNTANETDWIKFDPDDVSSELPDVGNLFSFGETARVTNEYRVLDVRPGPDLTAQFMLVDDAPAIEYIDPVPEYDPGITIPPDPYSLSPESLTYSEFFSGSGITAKATVQLTVQIPRVGTIQSFEFQYMDVSSNGDWTSFAVVPAPYLTANKDNLEDGIYNFRARALFRADIGQPTNNSSAWVYTGNVVVLSTLSPPPDITGSLIINVLGDVLTLEWTPVIATNVAFYRVKYNLMTDGSATWGNSEVLLTTIDTRAVTTARSGTYMVKAVSYSELESDVELMHVLVISPAVQPNIIEHFDEGPPHSPIFPGYHSFTQVQGLLLTLTFSGSLYTINQGLYQFLQYIDLGSVYTSRISSELTAYGVNVGDVMSNWPTLASVVALDNTDPSQWSVDTVYSASNGPIPKSVIQRITDLSLTTGLKLVLESASVASWTGSGQKWLDESGGGYDFFLGVDGTVGGNDPTPPSSLNTLLRTGSGSWTLDGGDFFTYDAVNEAWMNAIHQNNAKASAIFSFYVPTLGVFNYLCGDTANDLTKIGFQFAVTSTNTLRLSVFNGTGTVAMSADTTAVLTAPGWHTAGFSIDEATGTLVLLLDDVVQTLTGQVFTAPSAAASTYKLQLAAVGANGNPVANGFRLHAVAMWQSVALTSAQLAAIGSSIHHNDDWVFGPWTSYTVSDVTARILLFGVRLNGSPDGMVSPAVTKLGVTIDMPDRHLGFDIGAPGSGTSLGGYTILFEPPFKHLKSIALANFDLDTPSNERYTILSKDESHVTILFSRDGVPISKTFSLHAYGYGAVVT